MSRAGGERGRLRGLGGGGPWVTKQSSYVKDS